MKQATLNKLKNKAEEPEKNLKKYLITEAGIMKTIEVLFEICDELDERITNLEN